MCIFSLFFRLHYAVWMCRAVVCNIHNYSACNVILSDVWMCPTQTQTHADTMHLCWLTSLVSFALWFTATHHPSLSPSLDLIQSLTHSHYASLFPTNFSLWRSFAHHSIPNNFVVCCLFQHDVARSFAMCVRVKGESETERRRELKCAKENEREQETMAMRIDSLWCVQGRAYVCMLTLICMRLHTNIH